MLNWTLNKEKIEMYENMKFTNYVLLKFKTRQRKSAKWIFQTTAMVKVTTHP